MRCRSAAAVGEKALNPWTEAADAFPPGCGHSVARLRARQLEVRLAGYHCGGMRIVITADAVLLMDSRSAQVGVLPPLPPPSSPPPPQALAQVAPKHAQIAASAPTSLSADQSGSTGQRCWRRTIGHTAQLSLSAETAGRGSPYDCVQHMSVRRNCADASSRTRRRHFDAIALRYSVACCHSRKVLKGTSTEGHPAPSQPKGVRLLMQSDHW